MPGDLEGFNGLRAGVPAPWTTVSGGESGAIVLRDAVGKRYAKVVPSANTDDLTAERDRISWLAATDIPGATVLDWQSSDAGAYLITSAVAGVPADQLDAAQLRQAWPSITDTVRRLHDVPTASCPYDRTLPGMVAAARATVAEDRVHIEFLPEDLQATPPAAILAGLEHELPQHLASERTDAVVCHGDLCLPNILVSPDSLQVTGLIDLGRLGRADRYADLALLLATARETWPDEPTARRAEHRFAERYGTVLDPDRQSFYLRLDPLTW